MNKTLNKRKGAKSGFTIIESLVAITILVVVVTGAMSAVQTGISSYTFSKDQIIASYLAQEGFEQLRNIRDENWLNSRNWLTGIAEVGGDPCATGKACTVSPFEPTNVFACSSLGSCPYIRQDPVSGVYGYNAAWTVTPFRREITLTPVNADEVSIEVTIYWSKGASTREFNVRENILNWQ